jgi:hypothetical protein
MDKFLPPVKTPPPEPLDMQSASAWAAIIEAVIQAERIRTGKAVVDASCIGDSLSQRSKWSHARIDQANCISAGYRSAVRSNTVLHPAFN